MNSGFIIRLRPSGPWRFGPSSGARDRVDRIFHSDSLYSGLTHAMLQLGKLDEWLSATATAAIPAVRFSSCFPYLGEMLMAAPPRGTWPPALSTKVRWKGARFVPLSAIATLLRDKPLDDDRWIVDPESECLLPVEKNVAPSSPFRVTVRTSAAVDRAEQGKLELHSTACLEFAEGAGLWTMAAFADAASEAEWSGPVKAAFRLLADTGVGGERSRGWGRSEQPEFRPLADLGLNPAPADSTAYWLLSVYTPSAADQVDWKRGNYSLITRGGRIESAERWGDEKQLLRMVEEGSVIFADSPPTGATRNVAPEGFPHPVYRSGFALVIAIPWKGASPEKLRAAEPATETVTEQKISEPPPQPFEYEQSPIEPEPITTDEPASDLQHAAAESPATTELEPIAKQPAAAQPELPAIEPESSPVELPSATNEVEPGTTEIPPAEPAAAEPEHLAIEPESSPIEPPSATNELEPGTTEIPPAEPAAAAPEHAAIEPESSPIEPPSATNELEPSTTEIPTAEPEAAELSATPGEPEPTAPDAPAAEPPASESQPAAIEYEPEPAPQTKPKTGPEPPENPEGGAA